MKVLVLGASGGAGRAIVAEALRKGHEVTAQTRDAARLSGSPAGLRILTGDPLDAGNLEAMAAGQEAVIYALGRRARGPTDFFSASTAALISAMKAKGLRRLVAITGVGAGETRGHGGFLYDRIIFPLFTRHSYADKDRQEALIRASGLDWIIVRPASFARTAEGALQVVTEVRPETVLRRVTLEEVAQFTVAALVSDAHLRQAPFIGHP